MKEQHRNSVASEELKNLQMKISLTKIISVIKKYLIMISNKIIYINSSHLIYILILYFTYSQVQKSRFFCVTSVKV